MIGSVALVARLKKAQPVADTVFDSRFVSSHAGLLRLFVALKGQEKGKVALSTGCRSDFRTLRAYYLAKATFLGALVPARVRGSAVDESRESDSAPRHTL